MIIHITPESVIHITRNLYSHAPEYAPNSRASLAERMVRMIKSLAGR